MGRRNYFEILGLDFDPPEKSKKKIDKKIAEWKTRTEDLLANETISVRRDALTAELALYEDMVQVLKENKTKIAEARALKELRVSQLEQMLDIMLVGQSGTLEVTNAQIRNVHLKLHLSAKTIEETYVNKGFMVQVRGGTVNLNDVFLPTAVSENIGSKIRQLCTMVIFKYPWTAKVSDLYDLACYFSGGTEADTSAFHRKRTSELYSIMENGAVRLASDMSTSGHLLADLFTAGTTQVFDSESNRKKYDQSLEQEKLKDFFILLKSAPDIFKKDRYFAESCIRTIQQSFSDYDLSLALYNREAGLMQDPYEPVDAVIHVTCGSCKTPAEFRTRKEAEKGRCVVCGAPLFIDCPKCHKKIPASTDRCSCGFSIWEMQFLEEYLKAAEFALKELNLVEARKQLANAENAYPGHSKLPALRQRIKDETLRYQKPLNDLKALISSGKYSKAQVLLESVATSMPQLDLDSQQKIVSEKLNEARKNMPGTNMSPKDKANRCVEILQIVKDFQPAIDILTMTRPQMPLSLNYSVSGNGKITCTLTWNATGDKGVSYQIVRKENGIPQSRTDGVILSESVIALEYRDTDLQPGISYGYAVFAGRWGAYSDPATCEIASYSELDTKQVRVSADNGVCHFRWVLPQNCIGVRILRSINAVPSEISLTSCIVVAPRASANFDDLDVVNNTTYGYRLQCVYPYENGFRYSKGITMMLTPEQPPIALRDVTSKIEGCLVTISWNSPDEFQGSVLIQEVFWDAVRGFIGQVMPTSEINSIIGSGRNYANITGDTQQAQFKIPPNVSYSLAIVCISGAKGIISDIVKVSSVEKCRINRNETRIEGNRLKIVILNQPDNLEHIHYIVARKVGKEVPWATADDARRNMLSVVSLQDYKRDGMILIETLPKSDLYITVIGQYKMPDGSVLYSEPSKMRVSNKPKQQITYKLLWGSAGLFSRTKGKNCRLIVHSSAEETPEIKVVYLSDKHIPMSLDDPKAIVIHTIPETDSGFPHGEYIFSFPNSTWSSIQSGTPIRLFIQEEDMAEYEIRPSDLGGLTVP